MVYWQPWAEISTAVIILNTLLSPYLRNENPSYSPPYYPSPWTDGSGEWAEAYEKARNFVSELTLLEKINLTTGTGNEQGNCAGETGSIPRLNFSAICFQDSPAGVGSADYFVTAFPAGINVASAWSRDLAYRRGRLMGEEHRGKGVDVQLGPVVGPLGRAPEGGRNWEGFGVDPVSAGILAAETIKGIQESGVVACAKHFIGNEQERYRWAAESATFGEPIAEGYSANIDDKTMHELYLWPFADAVRAGVGSVVCAYSQINNSYSCSNSYIINKLLKAELGFQGFVVSDWDAMYGGVSSVFAGLDMAMPGDTVLGGTGYSFYGSNLTIGVLNGTIPEWRLDDMVTRIMAAFFKVGRDKTRVPVNFNSWDLSQYGDAHHLVGQGKGTLINQYVDVRGNHSSFVRELGAKSIVLLKNTNHALPLTGNEKFTAIIGEDSGSNPDGPNGCTYRACASGTLAMGWGSGSVEFSHLITPEQAITNEITSRGNGVVTAITNNYAIDYIQKIAKVADVALVFVNANSGEGFLEVDGNIGDRNNLTLWKDGDALIQNVASINNNTIVILHTVGPVLMTNWYDNPNVTAIVWAGLPGDESGNSLVDVLYGHINPGGKTPFTWGLLRESWSTHVTTNRSTSDVFGTQIDFEEGVFIDYRDFDRQNETPIYEFGFGLSYTEFQFLNLSVTPIYSSSSKYIPTTGHTKPAKPAGTVSISSTISDYVFPKGFRRIPLFIYPWLTSSCLKNASGDPEYGVSVDSWPPHGATNGSPQPRLPASGGPGGNPGLYEALYSVSVTIQNSGQRDGDEVPQLYISLGGPEDPKVALRNFERITIPANGLHTWTANITRRDISNWDPARQDWFVSEYEKIVYVGSSSRKLPLKFTLPKL
ncbi:beta-glucosidase I [Talaromyces proteolyticus]|uniref:beta-glucosidase n=1 Tax=Talaromyces proteolyticus TaxID=1131652 RepID=A0AAD4Q3A1_9EURO|nr:beta-glucosidase I [Talaromyces proteolyticus]KAH8704859.1 beta-glucosidase I [Talaromyces proteolyticus]